MQNQKGASLIITFFIMIIILSVVLSVSAILYSQVKVIRNIGSSVISYYIGESGIEKVLYYDRQVLPNNGIDCVISSDCLNEPYNTCNNGICTIAPSNSVECTTENVAEMCDTAPYLICRQGYCSANYWPRGLCSIFDITKSPDNYCKEDDGTKQNTSVFCNNSQPNSFTGTCSYDNCTNCTISFDTVFDANKGKNYSTIATISNDGRDFRIDSLGAYGETQRKVNIMITGEVETPETEPAPQPGPLAIPGMPCDILGEYVTDVPGPVISLAGADVETNNKITFWASLSYQEGVVIEYVQAKIFMDIEGACTEVLAPLDLQAQGSGVYSKPWNDGQAGSTYYFLIDARDTIGRHAYWMLDPVTLP